MLSHHQLFLSQIHSRHLDTTIHVRSEVVIFVWSWISFSWLVDKQDTDLCIESQKYHRHFSCNLNKARIVRFLYLLAEMLHTALTTLGNGGRGQVLSTITRRQIWWIKNQRYWVQNKTALKFARNHGNWSSYFKDISRRCEPSKAVALHFWPTMSTDSCTVAYCTYAKITLFLFTSRFNQSPTQCFHSLGFYERFYHVPKRFLFFQRFDVFNVFCCFCWTFFTARCTIVQSTVLKSHVVSLSVCLSVCDVGPSWPHRLKILETNCTIN